MSKLSESCLPKVDIETEVLRQGGTRPLAGDQVREDARPEEAAKAKQGQRNFLVSRQAGWIEYKTNTEN